MIDQNTLVKILFSKPEEIFNLPDPEKNRSIYQSSAPYPHLIVKDFFKPDILHLLTEELVSDDVNFTNVFTDEFQKGKTISTGDSVPPLISLLASKFAAPETLRHIEQLTGLKRLVPDPYYNTDYGYYHVSVSGGVLGSHVDHSRHSSLNIPHVLNLVVYLTEGWQEQDGGTLCLFDQSGKDVVTRVPCLFNHAVFFACTPTAYHGVEPIASTSGRSRHSVYFAYYSVDCPDSKVQEFFPAASGASSNADPSVSYGTYFIVPFFSLFSPKNWIHLRTRIIYLANLLLPPILMVGIKRIFKVFR